MAQPAPLGATADTASARPGMLVRLPDRRRINFRCQGHGGPTVLLESGWAATSLAWGKVQALVAPRQRICAYDRAGYGFSDPGPLPRDGAAIARDLDLALRAAHITGPFIVVGHSAGGLYVRLFADRRPRDVIGMVLVDPSVEYQDRRFAAVFGNGAGSLGAQRLRAQACLKAAEDRRLPSPYSVLARCAPIRRGNQSKAAYDARLREALRPETWRTQISELETLWTATSDSVSAGRPAYGDMPLIVLTAQETYAGAPAASALWSALHQELAARSSMGLERSVARSSHLMMKDRPDAIAMAIEQVAAMARNQEAVNRRPDETRK